MKVSGNLSRPRKDLLWWRVWSCLVEALGEAHSSSQHSHRHTSWLRHTTRTLQPDRHSQERCGPRNVCPPSTTVVLQHFHGCLSRCVWAGCYGFTAKAASRAGPGIAFPLLLQRKQAARDHLLPWHPQRGGLPGAHPTHATPPGAGGHVHRAGGEWVKPSSSQHCASDHAAVMHPS